MAPSKWTHSMCLRCWRVDRGHDATPTTLVEDVRQDETCCYCGETNKDGIYVRENPDTLLCHGSRWMHAS